MKQLIIHYDDNQNCKVDLYFNISNQQEMLAIIMRETSPEKLWARGWDKKYIWNEVR